MKQQEFIGQDSAKHLGKILKKIKPKMIFLVSGKKSYTECGAKQLIEKILTGYKVTVFNDFETNPKINDIKRGMAICKKNKCDLVLAIGGGSVIDTAKTINILSANPGRPENFILKKEILKKSGKKMIAIPTTTGSGSESTKFSVVYMGKNKHSLENKYMLPSYVFLDPNFIFCLPKYITASSGMDALCQAVESYWNINSTPESKKYSQRAIQLIMKNLVNAVNDQTNKKAKANISLAAHLAGKAINITHTTLPHAISYYFTSYFNVPHGQAAALTLGAFTEYNSDKTYKLLDTRGEAYMEKNMHKLFKLLGAKNSRQSRKNIENLMKQIGLETKLSKLGIRKSDIGSIVKNINLERAKNNPRQVTPENLKKILNDLL
jgi:alcohol dehydrogenase